MASEKLATLSLNPANEKWEAKWNGQVLASSHSKSYVVGNIVEGRCNKAKKLGITGTQEAPGSMSVSVVGQAAPSDIEERFTIDERFGFLENFATRVARRKSPSLIVSGEGGLGKTFTVHSALKVAGLINSSELVHTVKALKSTFEGDEDDATEDDYDYTEVIGADESKMSPEESAKHYVVIKGFSTAKGLYATLYENKNRIVVFDDCDSILRDPVALNLLKGALDSYERRIISWQSRGFISDGLPSEFEFKGGIIFVSNLPLYKIDQAIRSRSISVDLSMSTDQKLERMSNIIKSPKFLPEIPMKAKKAALEYLVEMKDVATEINFRTLILIANLADDGDNWKRQAEYALTAAN